MSIPRIAISRPVTTLMVTLMVVVFGAVALLNLPIDLMPDITLPRLSISTDYPNATPEEMEELVTRPIEEAVSAVTGVVDLDSISSEGRSRVSISFEWGKDLDAAANDVRDRLDRVLSRLPEDASRPSLRKFNLSDFPILILGVGSELNPTELRERIDQDVVHRLERADGVAAVGVHGGNEREIHVDIHADRVKALGLALDQIVRRVQEGNVNLPAGSVSRGELDVRVRTPGTYRSLQEIENTVVTVVDGTPVRVRDIADVEDAFKRRTNYVLINGRPGVRLTINKQSGTNTVRVAADVLSEVAKINEAIPDLEITTIINSATYIERAIRNMAMSAVFGGILAVLVLLAFLRDIRSTTVVALAIPISVIATFMLIYAGHYTLNIMTIGGLALGVGMLVDSAIVVVENIQRLRAGGMTARDATLNGSEEVSSAIIASTLTTLVVFLPLVFVEGRAGVMFKELALVVGFALVCSLLVAMSLVPVAASFLLRNADPASSPAKGAGGIGPLFSGVETQYRRALHWALDHRVVTAGACVLTLVASMGLAKLIGTELMPETDEGEVRVYGDMRVGTRAVTLDRTFKEIYRIVTEHVPEMARSQTFVGGKPWRPGQSNTGEMRISLVPIGDGRSRSDVEIAADLQRRLSSLPGVKIRTQRGQGFFLLNVMTRGMDRLNIEVTGQDLAVADALAAKAEAAIRDVDGVARTRRRSTTGMPEEEMRIDRRRAEQMHLSVLRIGNALQTVLSGTRAGEYRVGDGDEITILVKVKNADRLSPEEILDLSVTNGLGRPVVLRNVVSARPREGPVVIERTDKKRVVDVGVTVRGRDLGSVAADIERLVDEIPHGEEYQIAVAGGYEDQKRTFWQLAFSFGLAVALVYMVMASQFESLRDPFVVMFSVPFAAIGVILMLFLTDTTLNIQSFIGCIMLAGIVVNNAILLVDHTNLLRRRDGMPMREAIEEAGRRRLRPILMTALTTSLALVPLAIGLGEGGEAQAPMARAVIGGLLSATLITLVLVPVVYSVFEHRRADCPGDGE